MIEENDGWHDPKKWVSLIDKKGRTPLHLASHHGHSQIVRFIIERLCEVVIDKDLRRGYINLLDNKGRTVLYHAAMGGHHYIVRVLVDVEVSLEMSTNKSHTAPGSTAIMVCAEKGYEECFKTLLDKGSNLFAQRKDGADAFYLAAMNGHISIIKNIVSSDIIRIVCHLSIDKPTYRGRTPLCTAAFHGHLAIVKLLFNHGGNLNHKDDDGFTPLILASCEGHLKVVKWLLKNGSNVSARDKFGDTASDSSKIFGHDGVTSFIDKWQKGEIVDDIGKESNSAETEILNEDIVEDADSVSFKLLEHVTQSLEECLDGDLINDLDNESNSAEPETLDETNVGDAVSNPTMASGHVEVTSFMNEIESGIIENEFDENPNLVDMEVSHKTILGRKKVQWQKADLLAMHR